MDDALTRLRASYDRQILALSHIEDKRIRAERETELLHDEMRMEFAYRSGLIRGKIIGMSLERSMTEIIDEINETGRKTFLSEDYSSGDTRECQRRIRIDSDALIHFSMDYIDRWAVYNRLFQ